MDNGQLLQLVGGFAVGGLVAGGAVYAWAAKRLKREHERVTHVEQARQLGAQQLTQARKQVEQLQRENHELRLAVRPAPRQAPAPEVAAPDPAEAARLYAESKLNPPTAEPAPKTFKDTVVMPRSQY
ncbi:hypothetical protein ASC95_25120 [Pelomonas sp. Root1217]|uniref:hypothetical protein n=1 Tax=Pelomonas sp. Root1217 TaxID=1736430 RepID=UPI0007097093|nr:hypothetical protein [Pelomonas sp. Root1217]KQV46813.1 hypothetical protein ASC95_25120 [Pelomonas sp. Root1217]